MAINKELTFYGKPIMKLVNYKTSPKLTDDFIPVAGARSSVPTHLATFAPGKLQEIPNNFSVEYLSTLENLAAYDEYISYAVDNVVQLANTEHDIEFPDNISDSEKKKMLKIIRKNEENWYENSGGIGSLKADLLVQIVINGVLSAEFIPDKKLEKILKVVRVAPKHIVFVYDAINDIYTPYQKGSSVISQNNTGKIKLNTKTYKYIALRRMFETPYGMPPFISAIDALCTQKDMDKSFKNIMSKLGMLGFLSAEVVPPDQDRGESDTDYWERSIKYLSDVVYPQVEQNLSKGFVAGFKDKHEFKLVGNNMNVAGAEGLARLIKSRVFAGVKQDPNMLGSNEATTETFGRVVLAKMISQTTDYQRVVDRFFESLYMLELRLHGFAPDYINVISKKPLVGDQVKEQTAEKIKIENTIAKRNAGIISQETAAQELDYDKAAAPGSISENSEPKTPAPGADAKTDPTGGDVKTTENKAFFNSLIKKYSKYELFPYDAITNGCYHSTELNFVSVSDFKDKKMKKYINKYFTEIYGQHKDATKKLSKSIANDLLKLDANIDVNDLQNIVYLKLVTGWKNEFINPIKKIVKNNIPAMYNDFRKETIVFGDNVKVSSNVKSFQKSENSFETIIPEGVLDLDDFRTMTYLQNSDNLYLGKYITDPDVKAKVNAYINENYINGYLPIGNNKAALTKFQNEFAKDLDLLGWKIRRIIDTTVNKTRNYAHIQYLDQAAITKYEIMEINDQLTCDYCAHMDGKTFDVSVTKKKIKKEAKNGPGDVSTISPFITTQKIGDVQKMNASQLQSAGFNCPPYHPHCRGTFVANFDD